jgi:hypothetical protein
MGALNNIQTQCLLTAILKQSAEMASGTYKKTTNTQNMLLLGLFVPSNIHAELILAKTSPWHRDEYVSEHKVVVVVVVGYYDSVRSRMTMLHISIAVTCVLLIAGCLHENDNTILFVLY